MLYAKSDIKTVKHNNRMHTVILNDGSTATYYDSTVSFNHSYAIAYYQTRTGKKLYKSIVDFAADGTVKSVNSFYRPRNIKQFLAD